MSQTTTTAEATFQWLTTPHKGHMTILTTFRRTGEGVKTPVGTVAEHNTLYFMTPAHTWKVKRLANNPRVTLAPGTRKGEELGPAIAGTARRLYGEELRRARDLLRVGLVGHVWGFIFDRRYPGDKQAVYEITLDAVGASYEQAKAVLP